MPILQYIKGSAVNPIIKPAIIAHICNNIGGWGKGFVLALSSKWKQPEKEYRKLKEYILGNVQFVSVEDGIIVANMIAQHDIKPTNGEPPIRYDALKTCLVKVYEKAIETNSIVCGPKFGSGLAGGDWNKIEQIILEAMKTSTCIYYL